MVFKSRNTVVQKNTVKYSSDGLQVTFNVTTEVYVEGNPYLDLFTPKDVIGLTMLSSFLANPLAAQEQAELLTQEWVTVNYPTI